MKIALLKFGPLGIHWYGLLIAVALVVGVAISAFLARERGESLAPLAGILLLGLLSGMIGARVWYFVFRRDFYNPDPGRIFAVWQGGLAWHGALLGGVLGAGIYTWNREISFWTWADICAPGLILGQAIGRVGDIMNNQAFGVPSHGLWTVTIPFANRPTQYQGFSTFTNTAGYEAVWDALVFGALIGLTQLQRRRAPYLPAGSVFLAYLALYSLARLPLEGLRVDSLWVMNMRVAQLASGALIVVGGLLYALRLFQGNRLPAPTPALPASGPALAVARGETYLQPSAQYLIAASRGGQAHSAPVVTAALPSVNGHQDKGRDKRGLNGRTAVLPTSAGLPAAAVPRPAATSAMPEAPVTGKALTADDLTAAGLEEPTGGKALQETGEPAPAAERSSDPAPVPEASASGSVPGAAVSAVPEPAASPAAPSTSGSDADLTSSIPGSIPALDVSTEPGPAAEPSHQPADLIGLTSDAAPEVVPMPHATPSAGGEGCD